MLRNYQTKIQNKIKIKNIGVLLITGDLSLKDASKLVVSKSLIRNSEYTDYIWYK